MCIRDSVIGHSHAVLQQIVQGPADVVGPLHILPHDPQGRREVLDTIERLNREKGITVILITHHMDEAVRAGRVIAMSEGKIIADGTPQQVFAQEKLLRSVGLDVPQTEQLLLALRARGVDIPTDALTPGQCARLLRQYIPAV